MTSVPNSVLFELAPFRANPRPLNPH
jgi:hypothetical protein